MRPRVVFWSTSLLLAVFFISPLIASAAILPFFGPILPPNDNLAENVQRCAAAWGAVFIVVNNVIRVLLTIAIVFVAPLTIGYAGFLFVTSPASVSNVEKAKKILTNTVVGITIALASWLIVNAIMSVLYDKTARGLDGKDWWEIVSSGGADTCLDIAATQRPSDRTGESTEEIPYPEGDGAFSYQPGIAAQAGHASAALNTLLTCMAGYVPANVGVISSISDSQIVGGKTFEQCAAGGCQHSANSCHYGGRTCVGQSYAVDFGDEGNAGVLGDAARTCRATYIKNEGDHLHVSIDSGCGCN